VVQRAPIIGFLVAVVIGNVALALSQPKASGTRPDPNDKRPVAERLASLNVSDNSELSEAATAAGLRISRRFVGAVEWIVRVDERDVKMAGWLADPDGDATPLEIVVFVAGPVAGTARTQGERPDLINHAGLGFGAEKNIDFRVTFSCRAGDRPVVAGLGPKERYIPLTSPPCP
jgi:hypothetical protein